MTEQLELDLFPVQEQVSRKEYWGWLGYEGPAPGRYCDIDSLCVEHESGELIYSYMEQCRLIEKRQDGRWLAIIEMGEVHGEKWFKDGTRVLLREDDIWPPMRLPTEKRNEVK